MARYIDADKAMEEINQIGGHNLCEWDTIGVKALIDRQPTADVVPKSEVVKVLSDLKKQIRDKAIYPGAKDTYSFVNVKVVNVKVFDAVLNNVLKKYTEGEA